MKKQNKNPKQNKFPTYFSRNTSERPQLGLLVYYLQSYLQGYELILK